MCLFCDIQTQEISIDFPENTVLHRNEFFYTKPALGAFIEGYSLINSVRHVDSLRNLSQEELFNLNGYINHQIAILKGLYKTEILLFEHGSLHVSCNKGKMCIGRCIPHAHIHLVPTNIFPIDKLKNKFNWTLINNFSELYGISYQSYLLVSVNLKEIYVFEADHSVKSQYMRKMICNYIGDMNDWNWIYYPYRNRINKYLEKRKLLDNVSV